MNRRFPIFALFAVHVLGQTPRPNADPYANNAAPGTLQFPLAAPAGKDSGAITKAPAGAVNQGVIDEKTWKFGPVFDAPANAKIWNPVKLKLMRGEKVTGGTVFASSNGGRIIWA